MKVVDWLTPVCQDTPVELEVDFELVFKGTAKEAMMSAYFLREVQEAYIGVDGTKLVIALDVKKRKPRKTAGVAR